MDQIDQSLPRVRRTRNEIAELLTKFNASKLTSTRFCELHQLHKPTFHKWISRAKTRSKKVVQAGGFAPIEVKAVPGPALFAEVKGVRIYQPVAASYLKELIR